MTALFAFKVRRRHDPVSPLTADIDLDWWNVPANSDLDCRHHITGGRKPARTKTSADSRVAFKRGGCSGCQRRVIVVKCHYPASTQELCITWRSSDYFESVVRV